MIDSFNEKLYFKSRFPKPAFFMKQWVLNNRRWLLMTIAIYQVMGAVIGLWLLYSVAGNGVNAGFVLAAIFIVALILCSFFAGIFYFFKGETSRFFLLSKINFCAQLIRFAGMGLKFVYFYGFYFILGFDGAGEFQLYLGFQLMEFAVGIGASETNFFIINLFPILPLMILRWAERNPAKDPAENFLVEDEPVN